jgi:hypothetical protein
MHREMGNVYKILAGKLKLRGHSEYVAGGGRKRV